MEHHNAHCSTLRPTWLEIGDEGSTMCASPRALKTFEKSTEFRLFVRGGGSSKFLKFGFPRFRIFSFLSFFPSSRYDYGNSIEISVERKMRLVGIPRKTWCKEELNAKETRWYSVQISGKCSRFVDQCARRITQLGRKRDPRVLWKEWEEGLREGAVSIILLLSPVVSWWKIANCYFFQ